MHYARRKFLKGLGFGITVAFPAILRAQTSESLTQRKDFNMEIKRSGSQPSTKGPADWFTGTVRIDPLFQANAPARAAGASVTFEPGARTDPDDRDGPRGFVGGDGSPPGAVGGAIFWRHRELQ